MSHVDEPAAPRPGEIAPIRVPMARVVEGGLLCWLLALGVTLVVPALHDGARDWWPWACVAGLALGSAGWLYVRRGRGNAHDA